MHTDFFDNSPAASQNILRGDSQTSPPMTSEQLLYCLEFELHTLARIVTRGELERWTPGFCGENTHREHVSRYRWVKPFVQNLSVVDLACGVGFGSRMMADGGAAHVEGVDLCSSTVKYAAIRNRHERVDFFQGDAATYRPVVRPDVVVSFETIEHVPRVDDYMANISAMLPPGARFIVSTPIAAKPLETRPANPCHLREWGFSAFQKYVGQIFLIDDIYIQVTCQRPMVRYRMLRSFSRKPHDAIAFDVIKWNPRLHPVRQMGTTIRGYQVLVCTKR